MVEFTRGAFSVLIVLNVWNIITFYFGIFLHQFSQMRSTFSNFLVYFVVVQSLRHVQLCDPWTAAHQASLSFAISWSLLKLMSIELMIPSNHLILCRSVFLMPSVFPSIKVFSNEATLCIVLSIYQQVKCIENLHHFSLFCRNL